MKTFDITIPAVRHTNSAGETYTIPPRLLRMARSADGVWSYTAPPDTEPFESDENEVRSMCARCTNAAELLDEHFPPTSATTQGGGGPGEPAKK